MGETMAPGFFGKVPARGDFLSRRIPAAIAADWEAWLQSVTAIVRAEGRSGWQDAWLTAPLWHVTLGDRLVPPRGAAGVFIASADRVGRLFPFTLLGAAATAGARPEWARAAEALALSALDDTFDPGAFDARLAALGAPPAPAYRHHPASILPLDLEGDWPRDLDQVAPSGDQSAWWTRGSDRIAPTLVRSTGLPDAATARAMILGFT